MPFNPLQKEVSLNTVSTQLPVNANRKESPRIPLSKKWSPYEMPANGPIKLASTLEFENGLENTNK